MKKICFRCRKTIKENEDYYEFKEYSGEQLKKTDYAHKICWDSFIESVGDITKAKGMIGGLRKYLERVGLLLPEDVEVSI